MRLEAGFRPDPLGCYSAPDPLAAIRRDMMDGERKGRRREGRESRGKETCFMARGMDAPANILFATVRISLVFLFDLFVPHTPSQHWTNFNRM